MKKTTVVIDEKLLAEAMEAMGAKSIREAIETALRAAVNKKKQEALAAALGTFELDLTLEELEELRNAH